ncbi:MAG: hypothetical protein GY777_00175, partial [Candidatus Brocadiaceae bacterium]|nr:hypothetical protein [Candidatus Brocadiaceae bacterium]
MSDIFSNISGLGSEKRQVCHVAYTINNTQPVACSIIGDQPLFYMDYDIDYEDDDMAYFDAADMNVLEGELINLKNEIESFDNFSEDFSQSPDIRFQEFLSDKDVITGTTEKAVTTNKSQLTEILSKSRIAQAYIVFAKEHGVDIKLSSQVREAQYDRESSLIFVNPYLDFTDQILLTARELRR